MKFVKKLLTLAVLTAPVCLPTFADTNDNQKSNAYNSYRYDSSGYQAQGKFTQYQLMSKDGVMRPFVVYTPKDVQNDKRPLLVYLHGAVNMPTVRDNPVATASNNQILKLADLGGYYVLFPYGQAGATWFDDVGVSMVLDELAWAKQNLSIDSDKLFLGGFSDGASGTFYISHHYADQFAGFIAFNGALPVAAFLGEKPLYPENLNGKPFYVVNTSDDMLYPAAAMKTTMDFMAKYQPRLRYETPNGKHDMSYLSDMLGDLRAFMDHSVRKTHHNISLEVSDLSANQFDWLAITAFNWQQTAKPWHQPYRLSMSNNKASFGMGADAAYQDGFKVGTIKKDSTAEKLGVKIGDIVLKMGNVVLDNPYASYQYLSDKKAGDPTSLTVLRDGQELLLQGQFNPAYSYEVFEKTKPSAKILAQFDGKTINIETSKVGEFTIDFDKLSVNQPKIDVIINGRKTVVEPKGRMAFGL